MQTTRYDEPWAPYIPGPNDPWDLAKVAHLHRRAGFGGPGPSSSATWRPARRRASSGCSTRLRRSRRNARRSAGSATGSGTSPTSRSSGSKAYWLYRIVFGHDPLREKMTLFWHGHFATSNRKVQNLERMLAQNELFRRHALGDFRELATAILSDPAMLVWLDGVGNAKEKPNENLAREFLELFTLGVGHYAEVDIRQAARALTGWIKEGGEGDYAAPVRFDPARFDGGTKTFLGRTGAWNASDIARIALEQPAAARHLARKLYRFFVRDDVEPEAELIDPLADRIRASGFSIRKALEVIFRSRHFYSASVRRHLIKSPVEFTAGLVRILEVPRRRVDLVTLALLCDRQAQILFYPPNVKGWDGGRSWASSAALLARSNWVSDFVWGSRSLALEPFDPAAWASTYRIAPEDARQPPRGPPAPGRPRTRSAFAGAPGRPGRRPRRSAQGPPDPAELPGIPTGVSRPGSGDRRASLTRGDRSMNATRREFIRLGLGSSTLLACGTHRAGVPGTIGDGRAARRSFNRPRAGRPGARRRQ